MYVCHFYTFGQIATFKTRQQAEDYGKASGFTYRVLTRHQFREWQAAR